MSRSWVEKFAVFAMALGLVALAAVSVAALLIAAGVFICLAAILYIINPASDKWNNYECSRFSILP